MTQKSKQTPVLPTMLSKPENDILLEQDYNEKKLQEEE
jgi:hypothetical protein